MLNTTSRRLPNRHDFKVAVICALPIEAEMVELIFDQYWYQEDVLFKNATGDDNTYTFGLIGKYYVALAFMPEIGSNSAVSVADGLQLSFPELEIAFVVGICGVSPEHPTTGEEIVLGDCIIGTEIVQYDFGSQYPDEFVIKPKVVDSLKGARQVKSFIKQLSTLQNRRRLASRLLRHFDALRQREPNINIQYPGIENDLLFEASYKHSHHNSSITCGFCINEMDTCSNDCKIVGCKDEFLVERKRFTSVDGTEMDTRLVHPQVHLGRFGSANTVMKSGEHRERLTKGCKIVAFEMEGSGVWDRIPTIIIKTACDYADSHKNDSWQRYAAAISAAGLKATLEKLNLPDHRPVRVSMVNFGPTVIDTGVIHEHQWFSWLKLMTTPTDIQAISQEYHPDTGIWLLNHPMYKNWFSSQDNMFWLSGIPGSGKTVLYLKVLEEIQKIATTERKCVLFFCFNGSNDQRQSTYNLLQAVLGQLYQWHPASNGALNRLFMNCMQRHKPPSIKDLSDTLMEILYDVGHTYLLIDALDECKERDYLLDFLNICMSNSELSVFVTSRQQYAMEASAKDWLKPRFTLSMSSDFVNSDIEQYVHHSLQDRNRFSRWSTQPLILRRIYHEVIYRSNGCFRLTVSYLEEIGKCLNLRMLESKLDRLPNSLNKVYSAMLMGIDEMHIPYARLLLQLLISWPRVLRLDGAADILAMEPLDIGKICGNLVTIDRLAKDGTENLLCIRLAHPSIKEFLQSDIVPTVWQPWLGEDGAQKELYKTCMLYLSSVIKTQTSSAYPYNTSSFGRVVGTEDFPFLRTALLIILEAYQTYKCWEQESLSEFLQSSDLEYVMHGLAVHQSYKSQIMSSLHESRTLLYCDKDWVWDGLLQARNIAIRVKETSIHLLTKILSMVDLVAVEQFTRDVHGSRWTVLPTPISWDDCFRMANRVIRGKNILIPARPRSLSYFSSVSAKIKPFFRRHLKMQHTIFQLGLPRNVQYNRSMQTMMIGR